MKTNTVEQAERLLALGVDFDKGRQFKEWQDRVNQEGPCFAQGGPLKYKGPALTLDELHAVFTDLGIRFWPMPMHDVQEDCESYQWEVFILYESKRFERTTNHAADWTAILIWLIENKHVMVEQVNLALESNK